MSCRLRPACMGPSSVDLPDRRTPVTALTRLRSWNALSLCETPWPPSCPAYDVKDLQMARVFHIASLMTGTRWPRGLTISHMVTISCMHNMMWLGRPEMWRAPLSRRLCYAPRLRRRVPSISRSLAVSSLFSRMAASTSGSVSAMRAGSSSLLAPLSRLAIWLMFTPCLTDS